MQSGIKAIMIKLFFSSHGMMGEGNYVDQIWFRTWLSKRISQNSLYQTSKCMNLNSNIIYRSMVVCFFKKMRK